MIDTPSIITREMILLPLPLTIQSTPYLKDILVDTGYRVTFDQMVL